MIMRQGQVRRASMLGGAALVAAGFSDQQTRGAASPAVEVLPVASRECVSRLGEAFENGLDRQMTTALRYAQ